MMSWLISSTAAAPLFTILENSILNLLTLYWNSGSVWESKQKEIANIDNRYWYRLYQKKFGTNSGLVVSGLGVWSDE